MGNNLIALPIGKDRPALPPNIVLQDGGTTEAVWAKSCQCKRTTASGPRFFVAKSIAESDGIRFTMQWSWGPVYDSCDKPWQKRGWEVT